MRAKTLRQHTFMPLVAALSGGILANLVLWPRERLPRPLAIDPGDYFSRAVLERADAFREPQALLLICSMACLVVVPLMFALRRSRNAPFPAGRGATGKRVALAAAAITLAALAAALPFDLVAFARARNSGLVVQGYASWLGDWALQAAIGSACIAAGAVLTVFAVRRWRRCWWVAVASGAIAFALLWQLLTPLLIEPLFADFRALPAGNGRSDVSALAARAGVDPGDVLVIDAAERTTGLNAYVSGIGPTRRVVLYDTLLGSLERRQARLVIAHELGHARHQDLLRGFAWFAIAVLPAAWAWAQIAVALARRRGAELGSPGGVAPLLAAVMVVLALTMPLANAYSRKIEARADAFAVRLTGDPAGQVALERRLVIKNISRPDPPALLQLWFGTHPAPVDRIGAAEAVVRAR